MFKGFQARKSSAIKLECKVGDRIEANFKNKGNWIPGKILSTRGEGFYDIEYENGEMEDKVPADRIRKPVSNDLPEGGDLELGKSKLKGPPPSLSESTLHQWEVGNVIEANFKGRGKWFRGKISKCADDNVYDVDYDDGESETNIPNNLIRSPINVNEDNLASKLTIGLEIEANFEGKGNWIPGKITRIRNDGTYTIQYNNGESENQVTLNMIRLSTPANTKQNENEKTPYTRKSRLFKDVVEESPNTAKQRKQNESNETNDENTKIKNLSLNDNALENSRETNANVTGPWKILEPIRTDPIDALKLRQKRLERLASTTMPEIHYLGQISSCEGLLLQQDEGGYCRWKIDCGKAWEHISGDILGQTQVSYYKNISSEKICLNHPLDFHFAEAGLQGFGAPRILTQASKLDGYGRRLLCGYGFTDLPTAPGFYNFQIPLWRPAGSLEQELENFLLGATPALVSPDPIYETAWKERCRLVTVPAGIINIELFVITRFTKNHNLDEFKLK